MKKMLLLLLPILLSVNSCQYEQEKGIEGSNNFSYDVLKVVEIDSCEYIVYKNGYSGNILHKGNCKYCIERNKQIR